MPSPLEQGCFERGIKLTEQRRVITRVLSQADDHPDVDEVYRRASRVDDRISLATVYRTLRLLDEAGLIVRYDGGDGRARYEGGREARRDRPFDRAADAAVGLREGAIRRFGGRAAEEVGRR